MKIKSIFFIVIIILISSSGFAQKGKYVANLSYNVSLNLGKSKDYIDKASFRGGTLEAKQFINKNVALGLLIGWTVFNEEKTGLTEFTNGALFGKTAKYINYLPLMATVSYFFSNERSKKIKPYVVANIGAYDILQRVEIGVNRLQNDNWHFGLAPELGVMFQADRATNFILSARYNYALSSGETLTGDESNNFSWISINFGIGYNTW